MNKFVAWLLIPILTLLVSGPTDWFSLNFSVVCSAFPQNILLLLWAIVIGCFYHNSIRQTVSRTAPFLKTGPELIMTDLSFCLIIGAVFFPYIPSRRPLLSFFHLAMAFTGTVVFFIAITIVNLKLYVIAPKLFSLPTALLLFAIMTSIILLILCNFLITSALEIFLTIFSCFWLRLFDRRVSVLSHRKYMVARLRI